MTHVGMKGKIIFGNYSGALNPIGPTTAGLMGRVPVKQHQVLGDVQRDLKTRQSLVYWA